MVSKVITSDEMRAISNARNIIKAEHNAKSEILFQKFMGVVALCLSLAEFVMAYANIIDEGGISIIMIPLGIYLLITRKTII